MHPEAGGPYGRPGSPTFLHALDGQQKTLFELTADHMCACDATLAPTKKGASPSLIWLAEYVAINFEKEAGLFRWWMIKTALCDLKPWDWQVVTKHTTQA